MLNGIWLILVVISVVYAAFTGRMDAVTAAVTDSARTAVELVIGLVGLMVFMLGIMRVAFDGGLRDAIARVLAPAMRRFFPEVPPNHPAMGAMVMNMASNMLGMGNAATPFGLKAMAELAKLNRRPGVASNAMVLFLAINTSSITLMPPLGTVAIRAEAGSADPFAIWIPTLIATTCSTLAAVAAFFAFGKLSRFRAEAYAGDAVVAEDPPDAFAHVDVSVSQSAAPAPPARVAIAALTGIALVLALGFELTRMAAASTVFEATKSVLTDWVLPLLIVGLLGVGYLRGVRVYESAVAGAKEGLEVAVRILPFLVVILVAVAMFRASGALGELLVPAVSPLTDLIGVPAEVLPMALLRPLSGSGSLGVMSEIITANGPDSFTGQLTSTLMGSTETTFYVLALYLGAARVREGRHALAACLTGDVAGFFGAVFACHLFFG